MEAQLILGVNREVGRMKKIAATAVAIACVLGIGVASAVSSSGARAETVDMLLVLAADVSRSLDDVEFNLQRKGYAAAMTDPRVLRAIVGGRHHGVAVPFIQRPV